MVERRIYEIGGELFGTEHTVQIITKEKIIDELLDKWEGNYIDLDREVTFLK